MKGKIKKISSALIIIAFIIQPFLQIFMQLGEVQADKYVRQVTISSRANINNYLSSNQYAVLSYTSYRYRYSYSYFFSCKDVAKSYRYIFGNGKYFLGTRSDGGNVTLTQSGVIINEKKKTYAITGHLNASFMVDSATQNPPNITVHVSVNQIGVNINANISPTKSLQETYCTYNIYERTSSDSGSGTGSGSGSSAFWNAVGNYADQIRTIVGDAPIPSIGRYSGGSSSGSSGSSSGGTYTQKYSTADIAEEKVNISDDQKRLYIRRLYRYTLGKEPGIDYIENMLKNKNLQQYSYGVILGEESKKLNKIEQVDNTTYVKWMFFNILGREANQSDLNTYVTMLNEGYTRVNLIRLLINSDEFEKNWGTDKPVKTLKFTDADLCWGVWEWIKNPANHKNYNYDIVKKDRNTLIMFQYEVDKINQIKIDNKGLVDDLTGLSGFTNLQHLSVPNNKISDFNELSKLQKIKILDISGNGNLQGKLDPIWKLTNLTELRINNAGLVDSDINGNINKLTKLNYLFLNNNSINDLTSISQISSLKKIFMSGNKVSNLGNIDSLKLDDLSLSNTKLNYITTLNTDTQNEEVYVPFLAKVQDSKSYLYSKSGLECTNCKVENGKVIMDFNASTAQVKVKEGHATNSVVSISKNTQQIVLNDKALADRVTEYAKPFVLSTEEKDGKYTLTVISSRLYQIQNLNLSAKTGEEKIKDITGLENFVNLKSINLSHNDVQNIEKLSELKNLETLTIRDCGLTNLNSVKDMTNLLEIDASENSITNLEPLSNLTKLETVIVSNNNIGNNLQPLNKLSNLSLLSISDNNVSDLSSLNNLKLDKIFASYNSINSLNGINEENLEKVNLKNNNITINVNSKEFDIPEIIARSIEENGGTSKLEFTNCEIKDNKVVIDGYNRTAQIIINSGSFSDTKVVFQLIKDDTAPVARVNYSQANEGGPVTVTVTTDEITRLANVMGWESQHTYTNTFTKTFNYNTEEHLKLYDIYDNEAEVVVKVTNVKNTRVPGLTVKQSEFGPTKENVTLTIATTGEFSGNYGDWILSEDKTTLSRTFTENASGSIRVLVLEYIENPQQGQNPVIMHDEQVEYSIENIDKTAPTCEVEYNKTDSTKGSVRATIWSDEEICTISDEEEFVSNVTKIDNNGKKYYGLNFYFGENTNKQIGIKDEAGNTSAVNINISNIDNKVDGLNVQTSNAAATNQSVTVTLNANEAIKNVTESSNQANNSNSVFATLRKTFRINEPILLAASSLKAIPVMEGNNNLKDIAYVSDVNSGLVTRVAENEIDQSNNISVELPEASHGALEAEDNAGNNDVALYNTNNIDKDAPVVERKEDIKNSDGSITVTLVVNEQIQNTEDLAGWTLANDKVTLTKTFTANTNETVLVKDLAGNETEYKLEVTGVQTIPFEMYFERIENSDKYIVVIKTDREIQEVEGWTLLDDKKAISRIMNDDENGYIILEDYNGNSSEVYIVFNDIVDNGSEEGSEENNEQANQENQEDNTQSPEKIPQTGSYAIFTGGLIVILTALTFVTLRNYKKNIEN